MRSVLSRTVLLLLVGLATPVLAQEQTGNLQGKVTDASGGVMPGVTITVAGPTILGGSRSAVTTETGAYRLSNVPIGVYKVSFELSGFSTKVYEGIRIQADTTFTLDAQLGLASVQESVIVSGAAPVIDTAATNVGFTFNKELMNTIPNARDVWAMVTQAPGVVGSTVNVGGTQTGNQMTFRGHGVDPRQNTYILNGANVTDNTNNGGSQFFFDVDSFEEMQVEVNSHSAEVQTPGMVLNIVPKSGTNALHGAGSVYYGNDGVQSNNVDDALRALGVNRASNLHKYLDSGFDLGGPIVKDKVWFWGAYRYQEVQNFITGTVNPDGSFPIDRTYLWYPSGKVNWQVTPSHNFSAYFNMAQKKRFKRGLSALRPPETTQDQQGAPIARLFTLRDDWTASSRLLVSLKANVMDQGFELKAINGVNTQNTPAQMDVATGAWAAAPPNEFGIGKDLRSGSVTVSYYVDRWLGGQNDFKFGGDVSRFRAFGNQGGSVAQTTYPADHRLLFFNGAPFEVLLFQSGAQRVNNPTRSAYAQDSWKHGRLTLNVGGRWDWQANSLAAVTAPQSRFFNDVVSQPDTGNLITWNTFAPRVGAIFDVTGDSKTLVKGSYSRYYWQLWTDKASAASVAADRTYTYQWSDLNGDRQFTTGELGQLLSVDDPARNPVTIDPDLKPARTDEIVAGITRELMPNVSVSASYMHRKDQNLDWRINQAITPADYSQVIGTDPGPDGKLGTADDGGSLAFYELNASKRTLSPNFITTRQGFSQEYSGVEMSLIRRLASRWQFVAALTIGQQKENYDPGSFQNPQDIDKIDGTRVANSNPYIAKLMGSYQLPYGVLFSAYYQYISGNNFTRTVNAISALGRNLNQGNVAVLAERRNQESYDALNLLDFRVGYTLPGALSRVSLALDAFNILNVNTITSTNTTAGPRYGQVLDFVPPRILRFGAKVRF